MKKDKPFVRIIGIGDSTSSLLDRMASTYGENVSVSTPSKDSPKVCVADERLAIVIVDDDLSELVCTSSYGPELLLVMSTRQQPLPPGADSIMVGSLEEIELAIRTILDIILSPSVVSLDFNDVCTTLKDSGRFTALGVEATEEEVLSQAVSNLLARADRFKSTKLLLYVTGAAEEPAPKDIPALSPLPDWLSSHMVETDVVWGLQLDPRLHKDAIRVGIILAL